MHIPDGFLSAPVWATLDVAAAPGLAYIARKAQHGFDEARVPLLGVMGAFVFAAQMINFPVGIGTTGHLVGGALLAITLGPAAAAAVMAAIVTIQALVFQDGGVLALGANLVNMAMAGVLAGYLPYHIWGTGKWRKAAIFGAGAVSVLVSALLALAELALSGVRMPGAMMGVSIGLFAVSAALEGAITLAVVQALEAIQPGLVHQPVTRARSFAAGALAVSAVLLASVGVLFAATDPDGIEKLGRQTGMQAKALLATPLSDYRAVFLSSPALGKAVGGLAGLILIYGVCLAIGRVAERKRST